MTVYRLVTAGSIEERIVEMHRDKRALADGLLEGQRTAPQRTAADDDQVAAHPVGPRQQVQHHLRRPVGCVGALAQVNGGGGGGTDRAKTGSP